MANKLEQLQKELAARQALINLTREELKISRESAALNRKIQSKAGITKEEFDYRVKMISTYKEQKEIQTEILRLKEQEKKEVEQINETIENTFRIMNVGMPGAIKGIVSGQKSILQIAKDTAKALGGALNILTSWRGAIGLATLAIGATLEAQKRVNATMEEWRRAMATVAKEVGGIGNHWKSFSKEVSKTYSMTAGLGWSFQDAAEHVKAMSVNFSSTKDDVTQLSRLSVEYAQGLGLGSDNAGKLLFSFNKAGLSLKQMKTIQFDTINVSKKMGIPIGLIARDMADAQDHMAAFGRKGMQAMPSMVAYARQFGVAFGSVAKSMEMFDKMSTGAEAVGKLGAMFGVQMNAMEMLVETDPAKRLEKMRNALLGAGKEWKNMSYYEVKALSQTLGLSQKEIQMIFDKKKEYKSVAQIQRDLEKERVNEEKAEKKRKSDMSTILRETSNLFRNLTPQIKAFEMALNNAFAPLYDQLFGSKKNLLEGVTDFFNKLAKDPTWISGMRTLADTIKYLTEKIRGMIDWLTGPEFIKGVSNWKLALGAYAGIVGTRTAHSMGGGWALGQLGKYAMSTSTVDPNRTKLAMGLRSAGPILGKTALGAGAGYGVSSLINAGLGGLGLEKMGTGAMAGGSAGAGIGANFGPLGSFIGYGLGVGAGTGYDVYSKLRGPSTTGTEDAISSARSQKDKLKESVSMSSAIMQNEKDKRMLMINQIEEQFKAGKKMADLTEDQQKLISKLNPQINELSTGALDMFKKKVKESYVSFENMLKYLQKFDPSMGKLEVEGLTMSLSEKKKAAGIDKGKSQVDLEKELTKTLKDLLEAEDSLKLNKQVSYENTKGIQDATNKVNDLKTKAKLLGDIIKDERELKEKMLTVEKEELKIKQAENFMSRFKIAHGEENLTNEQIKKIYQDMGASEEVLKIIESAPRKASGGIVTHPTLAMVGEAGPEAIIPLNGQGAGGGKVYMQPIKMTLNGREVGQALVEIALNGAT